MKRQVIQLTLVVAVSLTLAMAVGTAQTSVRAVADIPFGFHVGKAMLPAGQYKIHSGFPIKDTVSIQSKDGSRNAVAMALPVSPMKRDGDVKGKLVFIQYGSDYYLSQVWNPDDTIVRGLTKTKAEMEVAGKADKVKTIKVALKEQ